MSCCDGGRYGGRGPGCGGMGCGGFDGRYTNRGINRPNADNVGLRRPRLDYDRDDWRYRRFDYDRDDWRRRRFDYDGGGFWRGPVFDDDGDDIYD
jgi:hypothetical protein